MSTRPEMIARFVMDERGSPSFVEKDGRRHYSIELNVDGAPSDAYAVTYKLDESYYDPVRESVDRKNAFVEKLTTYGDYPVAAIVRTKSGNNVVTESLSKALARAYPNAAPAVARALRDIREN